MLHVTMHTRYNQLMMLVTRSERESLTELFQIHYGRNSFSMFLLGNRVRVLILPECFCSKHGALVLGTKLILVPVLQLVEVSCGQWPLIEINDIWEFRWMV